MLMYIQRMLDELNDFLIEGAARVRLAGSDEANAISHDDMRARYARKDRQNRAWRVSQQHLKYRLGLDDSTFSMRQVSTLYGMWTLGVFSIVKSQDILLLFKLASLHAQEENLYGVMESEPNLNAFEGLLKPQQVNRMAGGARVDEPLVSYLNDSDATAFHRQALDSPLNEEEDGWEGWSDSVPSPPMASWSEGYSLRALSASLGISKSEISNSLARCREAGMLISDYDTGLPKVNRRELLKITEHALKYFFPVKPGAMVRGIPTGFAAPALSKSIKSAGELIPVWPDALGAERGQAIEPLYKTVPEAVKKDRTLYHYLALADAIRLGGPRECGVAINILRAGMGLK